MVIFGVLSSRVGYPPPIPLPAALWLSPKVAIPTLIVHGSPIGVGTERDRNTRVCW